jgi:hypothetical protein
VYNKTNSFTTEEGAEPTAPTTAHQSYLSLSLSLSLTASCCVRKTSSSRQERIMKAVPSFTLRPPPTKIRLPPAVPPLNKPSPSSLGPHSTDNDPGLSFHRDTLPPPPNSLEPEKSSSSQTMSHYFSLYGSCSCGIQLETCNIHSLPDKRPYIPFLEPISPYDPMDQMPSYSFPHLVTSQP